MAFLIHLHGVSSLGHAGDVAYGRDQDVQRLVVGLSGAGKHQGGI